MGLEKDTQAEDLELTGEEADRVKGGMIPIEGGDTSQHELLSQEEEEEEAVEGRAVRGQALALGSLGSHAEPDDPASGLSFAGSLWIRKARERDRSLRLAPTFIAGRTSSSLRACVAIGMRLLLKCASDFMHSACSTMKA